MKISPKIYCAFFVVTILSACTATDSVQTTADNEVLVVADEPARVDTEVEPVATLKRISFAAVGDIQMGQAWPEEQAKLPKINGYINAWPLFEHVADTISAADVAFGNLETVIADSGDSKKCRKSGKCFAFRVPSTFVGALEEAGFDLLSHNNNHANDFGPEGLQATVDSFVNSGIAVSSREVYPAEFFHAGVKITMIAFTTGGRDLLVQDIPRAVELVEELRKDTDILIVSFHGGAEGRNAYTVTKETEYFYSENRGNVYEFAHAVIDAGADVVLGHGPHVLRAMEIYNGKLIAYSLGNFTSWKTFKTDGALGESVILNFELLEDGTLCSASLMPVKIWGPGIPSIEDDGGHIIQRINELSLNDLGASMFDDEGVYRSETTRCEVQIE